MLAAYNDPRGPAVKIVEVHAVATDSNGTYAPVKLSCGHVGRFNAIFSYREGDWAHCYACKVGAKNDGRVL